MDINWYPGHMAKTRRAIEEVLPSIDVVAEIVDARIPSSSRNPDLARLTAQKPRVMVLNKSDLADPEQNKKWLDHYRAQGYEALLFDSKNKKTPPSAFTAAVRSVFREGLAKSASRGIVKKTIRLMVLGVPNVGKSTFINAVCGSNKAHAEDRPGVTRTGQWVPVDGGLDLLDMPGMLWGKLEDQEAARRLAATGAVSDLVVDTEELAAWLAGTLAKTYPAALSARYKLPPSLPEDDRELLELIGKKRGYVVRGGEIDTERTALMLFDEFRGGKLGRVTLDTL